MPIYEYQCEPCDRTFETLIRKPTDSPRCPSCGGDRISKRFSVPAAAHVRGGVSSRSELPICGAGAPAPGFGCGAGSCGSGFCSMD